MTAKKEKKISKYALQRLPFYLSYLKKKKEEGVVNISSPIIAHDLDLNGVQVRKDIASVSKRNGKPKMGHNIDLLIQDMESYLGYNNEEHAVIVGTGQLGKALLHYRGFSNYGLKIISAFDCDPEIIGKEFNGVRVYSVNEVETVVEELNVHIGIITVPDKYAQEVCDKLIRGGVLAIWNFAPIHLNVPDNILLHNENMASSLAVLSRHLKEKISKKSKKV